MNLHINLYFYLFFILISTIKSFTFENKILFKINNEIITSIDIKNEAKYLSLFIKDFELLEEKKFIRFQRILLLEKS